MTPTGVRRPARRILVVEDEPAMRLMLDQLLRLEGHTVHLAASADDARAAVAAHELDVVVCDLSLRPPAGGGVALAHELRPIVSPHVRFVAFTGDVATGTDDAVFDAVVIKASGMNALLDALGG